MSSMLPQVGTPRADFDGGPVARLLSGSAAALALVGASIDWPPWSDPVFGTKGIGRCAPVTRKRPRVISDETASLVGPAPEAAPIDEW